MDQSLCCDIYPRGDEGSHKLVSMHAEVFCAGSLSYDDAVVLCSVFRKMAVFAFFSNLFTFCKLILSCQLDLNSVPIHLAKHLRELSDVT